MCKLSLKLYKTTFSIGFYSKSNLHQVTPNFVNVQGHFPREELGKETECKLLHEHLSKHYQDLKEVSNKYERNKEAF